MSTVKIKDNIYWVGAVDAGVRDFHGYLTPYGTTYNAYLILDEKVTLIDTVRAPFTAELLENIREIVDPAKIDCLVSNHVEPDHSGALPALVDACPNATVFASPNGQKGLSAYYPGMEPRWQIVKAGDTLTTGRYTFEFLPMPMVHWPDSMTTCLREEKIAFTNDAMGQHIASPERFDDGIGRERLLERAANYYANIVLPYGMQVQSLLGALGKLPVEIVAPSHGVILRSFVNDVTKKYDDWSQNKTDRLKAVVVYDTMWGATRAMAEAVGAEFAARGMAVEYSDLKEDHVSVTITKLLEAGTVAVGSPTLNRQVMPTVGAFLCYLKGLAPKNRTGLAFGAYGWSGESAGLIEEALVSLKWEMLPTRKIRWRL